MSYWGTYEGELNGGFPVCNPEYAQYFNNMSYYNDPNRANYSAVNTGYNNFSDGRSYSNYMETPGPSQVTNWGPNQSGEDSGTDRSTGALKKKSNERKYWNNARKTEKYGSGRMFTRNRPEQQRRNLEDEDRGERFYQRQEGRSQNNNYNNRYKNNNYRGRDRFDSYEGRGYGSKYGKSSRNYDDYGADGRDWRSNSSRKCSNSVQKKCKYGLLM